MRTLLPISFAVFMFSLTLGLFAPRTAFYLSPSEYVEAVNGENLKSVVNTLHNLRLPYQITMDGKTLSLPESLMNQIKIEDEKIVVAAKGLALFKYLHYKFGQFTSQFMGLPLLRHSEKWYDSHNLTVLEKKGDTKTCMTLKSNLSHFFNNPKVQPQIINKTDYQRSSLKSQCELKAKSGILNLTINNMGVAKIERANKTTYLSCPNCLKL